MPRTHSVDDGYQVVTTGTQPASDRTMKRSLVRLFVAVVGLLAALVELTIRVVQLVILLVNRLASRLEACRSVLQVAQAQECLPGPSTALLAPPPAPPVTDAEQRLIGALTGPSLGFRVGPARAFAAKVRTRLATESIDGLVREGIVHLSAS